MRVKTFLGRLHELRDRLFDVVAQHLGGSCVRGGGELVQGGFASVNPVPVGVGRVGDTGVGYDYLQSKFQIKNQNLAFAQNR